MTADVQGADNGDVVALASQKKEGLVGGGIVAGRLLDHFLETGKFVIASQT